MSISERFGIKIQYLIADSVNILIVNGCARIFYPFANRAVICALNYIKIGAAKNIVAKRGDSRKITEGRHSRDTVNTALQFVYVGAVLAVNSEQKLNSVGRIGIHSKHYLVKRVGIHNRLWNMTS